MVTAHPAGRDPRGDAQCEEDVRPSVGRPARRLPVWIVGMGIALAALLLFAVLEARRRSHIAPTTASQGTTPYERAAAAPPTLFVPPVAPPPPTPQPTAVPPVTMVRVRPSAPPRYYPPPGPPPSYSPPPQYQPPSDTPPPQSPLARASGGSVIVYDATQADPSDGGASGAGGGAGAAGGASALGGRVRASLLRNGATTVPQGTLIPAVLETALDSTRPGLARALVQRDVVGFDGSRVLIPRGSRLIGEYRADLLPGQNRASVLWTRLVRPDGVTIAIGSPAADTLGRGGIRGSVNSHFLARFGAAILQSTLDVGVALASRAGNNSGVIISAPGLGGVAGPSLGGAGQVRPTLTVRQGTALSVFVARDLDFSGVGAR